MNTLTDSELIDRLGGPAKLAARLGYDAASGGVQRVHNWKKRGIPPRVRLDRPEAFVVPADDGAPPVPEQDSHQPAQAEDSHAA